MLYRWVENKNILSDLQGGFRAKRSTIDQWFILKTLLERAKRKNQIIWGVLVDIKEAFDSVNRSDLWFKHRQVEVSDKLMDLLISKYKNATFKIRMSNGRLSESVE